MKIFQMITEVSVSSITSGPIASWVKDRITFRTAVDIRDGEVIFIEVYPAI